LSKHSVGTLISRAKSFEKRGESTKAKQIYESILNDFPKNQRALHGLSKLKSIVPQNISNCLPEQVMNEVLEMYSQSKFGLLIDKILEISKRYEPEIVPWSVLGAAYASYGKLDEAISAFRKATFFEPMNAEAHYNLATAFKQVGNLGAAIDAYQKVIELNPNHTFALNNLGILFKEKKMLDEAVEVYQKAINTNPNYAFAFNNLGVALAEKGEFEKAIISYQKAIDINADYSEAYYNLAYALHKIGSLSESIAASRKALSINSDHPEALINMGNVLQDQGNLVEALSSWRKALRLNPNSANAYFNIGNALCEQESIFDAISAYKTAIRLKPDYAEAYHNLGRIYAHQQLFDDALCALGEAIRTQPDYAEAYNNMGMILHKENKLGKAKEAYTKAIILKSDYAEAYNNMGMILHKENNLDEAIEAYTKAIMIKSDYAEAYNNLGITLQKQEMLEEAIKKYEIALSINPDFAEAYNNIGAALRDAGRYHEAYEAFTHALSIDPECPNALDNLGKIYWLWQDFTRAFELMEWRWRANEQFIGKKLESTHPTWNGEELAEVFVWKEQGIGDEIMFSSMLSELNAKSKKLIVECDKRLIPLYERSFSKDIRFIADRHKLSDFDYDSQIAIGSLPKHFRHKLEDFTNVSPGWLEADLDRSKVLREKLKAQADDIIIGISWCTQSAGLRSYKRNIPLELLAEYLKRVPGKYINLQYGDTAEEILEVKNQVNFELHTVDEIDLYNDIDGLAALISACDTVISIDNLTVHLAGALGIDTRVLLPEVPDVRWGITGSNTYWYDHLALYRQESKYGWENQLERLTQDLLGQGI